MTNRGRRAVALALPVRARPRRDICERRFDGGPD